MAKYIKNYKVLVKKINCANYNVVYEEQGLTLTFKSYQSK